MYSTLRTVGGLPTVQVYRYGVLYLYSVRRGRKRKIGEKMGMSWGCLVSLAGPFDCVWRHRSPSMSALWSTPALCTSRRAVRGSSVMLSSYCNWLYGVRCAPYFSLACFITCTENLLGLYSALPYSIQYVDVRKGRDTLGIPVQLQFDSTSDRAYLHNLCTLYKYNI